MGTDQASNLILEKCEERVFSSEGTEVVPLGLFLLRGDSLYVTFRQFIRKKSI